MAESDAGHVVLYRGRGAAAGILCINKKIKISANTVLPPT